MAATVQAPIVDPVPAERLYGYVERARTAARAFRRLDQEAVDAIVWAMVVAGLEHAVDLAELAMAETGFGVFEDKVLKNYIATEFLYDYLKDKRTVGVISEDPERNIPEVAEPMGVVLGCCPSPTRPRRRRSSRWSRPRRATRSSFGRRRAARRRGIRVGPRTSSVEGPGASGCRPDGKCGPTT
jgi:hypothetical protein